MTLVARDSRTGLTGQGVYRVQVDNPPPPMVSDGCVTSTAGASLNLRVTVSASHAYTLTLSGAPNGLTINSSGVINWPSPVAGSYSFKVNAKDNLTGLSGQGTCLVVVNAGTNAPPVLSSGSFVAKSGTPFKFTPVVNDLNPCSFALSGAPSGMSINSSGLLSWTNPAAGNYTFSVLARDSRNGLSGQGSFALSVGSAAGPVITSTPLLGLVGQRLDGTITITNGGAGVNFLGVGGGPLGMSFAPQAGGLNTMSASWTSPLAGNYLASLQCSDSAGLKALSWIPISIRK
ncbi:putative Ig domain-containing protein [bacterium]|nr:putative Ig domain-containing protein [bacterium]